MQSNNLKGLVLTSSVALLVMALISPNQNDIFLTYGQKTTIPKSIDGVECNTVEHLAFHNHTKLLINIDNKPYKIPPMIGIIPGDCIFWLHTHDDSGFIHIESPIKQTFHLGQFFQIWNTFENPAIIKQIMNNGSKLSINATIDGKTINTKNLNINDIKLKDKSTVILNITKTT